MSKRITIGAVESKLKATAVKYDLIGLVLGDHKEEFLQTYLAFNSQLKDGDRLEIDAGVTEHEHYDDVFFRIVLYPRNRDKCVLYSGSRNISIGNSDGALYSN